MIRGVKSVNSMIVNSTYFGVAISIVAYWIGSRLRKKWNYPIMNPLLIAMILIITFLGITKIDYETYDKGAKYITFLLTPATVCLAVPLYKQIKILKENMIAVFVGIICGCISHVVIIIVVASAFGLEKILTLSMLPKSVTTAIALGITEEIGGIQAVTIVGVCVAGIMGAVIGPTILKIFHISEPVAQGLAIGTASHAVGTSKAVELGEIQAAMSSLAIVVTGLLTVVIVPLVVKFLF